MSKMVCAACSIGLSPEKGRLYTPDEITALLDAVFTEAEDDLLTKREANRKGMLRCNPGSRAYRRYRARFEELNALLAHCREHLGLTSLIPDAE